MALNFSDCTNPWTTLLLYPEQGGCIGPCCHFAPPNGAFPFGMKTGESLAQVWNSEHMQQLRRSIATGKPHFDTCRTCPTLRFESNFGPELTDIISQTSLSNYQIDNAKAALSHFKSGDSEVSSFPLFYLLRFGCGCNLKCIMCNHDAMRKNHDVGSLDFEWLNRQEDAFKKAYIVTVTGGEPLFIKSGRDFISWFLSNEKLRGVDFHICTNGILLDTVMPLIKNHNVTLEVSIDSFGELYERIRVGGSWKRLADNIDAFLRIKEGQKPNNMLVRIHCTLTLTGLPGLPDLVRWTAERKLGLHFAFMEIRELTDSFEESMLDHPRWMRQTVPDWGHLFKQTISILEQEDIYKAEAVQLKTLYDQLVAVLNDLHGFQVDRWGYEDRMHALWRQREVRQAEYRHLQEQCKQALLFLNRKGIFVPEMESLMLSCGLPAMHEGKTDTLSSGIPDYEEQLRRIEALQYEVVELRNQRDNLMASRWRKLGQKLGIAKTLPFEMCK